MWIKDYIDQASCPAWLYCFYEAVSDDSTWFEAKLKSLIPAEYEERRQTTMLEL